MVRSAAAGGASRTMGHMRAVPFASSAHSSRRSLCECSFRMKRSFLRAEDQLIIAPTALKPGKGQNVLAPLLQLSQLIECAVLTGRGQLARTNPKRPNDPDWEHARDLPPGRELSSSMQPFHRPRKTNPESRAFSEEALDGAMPGKRRRAAAGKLAERAERTQSGKRQCFQLSA
jgi:hypothetical protein